MNRQLTTIILILTLLTFSIILPTIIQQKPVLADTATYYFNDYSTSDWNNPVNIDSSISTWAFESNQASGVLALDENSYSSGGTGTITKVELRAYVKYEKVLGGRGYLRPVFSGGDGDNHIFSLFSSTGAWTSYFDITSDTNAPSTWTWSLINSLDCDLEANINTGAKQNIFVAKIDIRVTYSINTAPVNDMATESPTDGATSVSLNPTISITINDSDSDTMNQTFLTNASGTWTVIGWHNSTSNATVSNSTTVFNSYSTKYWLRSNVSDGNGGYDEDTWSFTTRAPTITYESSTFGGNVTVEYTYTTTYQTESFGGSVNVESVTTWHTSTFGGQVTIPEIYSFTISTASPSGNFEFKDWTLTLTSVGLTTQYNVSEDNQTSSISALNITNTGNVPLNFTAYWLTPPGSGISMKYSTTNTPPNPSTSTISESAGSPTQIITNLQTGQYEEIWLWMDFVSVGASSSQQDIRITSSKYQ